MKIGEIVDIAMAVGEQTSKGYNTTHVILDWKSWESIGKPVSILGMAVMVDFSPTARKCSIVDMSKVDEYEDLVAYREVRVNGRV